MKMKATGLMSGTAMRCAVLAVASVAAMVLAGCSAGLSDATPKGHAMQGVVHGGQQPVSGATITLYGVNAATLKGASSVLATTTTDGFGGFDLTGLYTCTGNPYVYVTATGGATGFGVNANLALMAVLEDCNTLQTNAGSTFIFMNEITTVAGAYALAPFMGDIAHVGTTPAYATGLANAFSTANALVNFQTGNPSGPNLSSNAVLPTAEINTLANVIASCVNGNTATAQCANLFTYATPPGGSAPADTATAAANIAQNPGQNVTAIFNLSTANPPFAAPVLGVAPQDWTVALKYTDTSLNTPYGIAFDASGNAWVANESGTSVTKLAASGAAGSSNASSFTGGGAVLGPQGIAVDRTGNVWLANTAFNSVVKLTSAGSLAGNYTSGTISGPTSIAMDSAGNAWVTNYDGGSIVEVSAGGVAGSAITGTGAGGTIVNPGGLAIDTAGNVWVANGGPSTMVKFNSAGAQQGAFTDNNLLAPLGVGIDTSNNVFVAANSINVVSGFSSSGSALVNSPASGGGLSAPTGVAVDGAANVWVTNGNTGGTLSKIVASSASAQSPSTGLGSLNAPAGVAVDLSGNVWTANSGDNTITQFVGLGSPTVTPVSLTAGP